MAAALLWAASRDAGSRGSKRLRYMLEQAGGGEVFFLFLPPPPVLLLGLASMLPIVCRGRVEIWLGLCW